MPRFSGFLVAREDSAAEPSESAAAAKAKITKIHKTLCNQNKIKKRSFVLKSVKFGPSMLFYLQNISF
ncbi:hypothetical protein DOY81_001880 [Sarcophaga bullata]|nr:hypothetical protein DOY81_001880 [Sarcophaga bullata]